VEIVVAHRRFVSPVETMSVTSPKA